MELRHVSFTALGSELSFLCRRRHSFLLCPRRDGRGI